jgi:hypothetical protein
MSVLLLPHLNEVGEGARRRARRVSSRNRGRLDADKKAIIGVGKIYQMFRGQRLDSSDSNEHRGKQESNGTTAALSPRERG